MIRQATPAGAGLCRTNECYTDVASAEVCCCNSDRCNGGILSSKSTFALILSTLAMLLFFYQF